MSVLEGGLAEVCQLNVNYVRIVCELCGTAVMVNRVTSEARYPVNEYYHTINKCIVKR